MFQHKNIRRFLALVGLGLLCLCGGQNALAASSTAAPASLQTVAQSYSSATSLQKGLIVQVDPKNSAAVIADTLANVKKMSGVVVAASDAPIALSSNTISQPVYVVSSGRYNVLVTNQNGTINSGDYITVSALDGVGMKADGNEGVVLGRAAASFDGKHNAISTVKLRDSTGREVSLGLGMIAVDIAIEPNPIAVKNANETPVFLEKTVQLLVDKPVSALKIYFGLFIVIASTVVAGSLMFSGVQSGMVSIGRNPLARKSIMRNLIQVIVSSLIIFIGGLFAVYLLLKL